MHGHRGSIGQGASIAVRWLSRFGSFGRSVIINPYTSVAEDIEWLRDEWWLGQPDDLSEGHLRRGSAALQLLLTNGLAGNAWRHYGFKAQPIIYGPDIIALTAYNGLRLEHAASLIAGGGRVNGVVPAFIGAFRVDNPTTGVSADAESGFAVVVTTIARGASQEQTPGPLDSLVERAFPLSNYLEAPGAVRRGIPVSRREIIEYFRNYVGGAHHDLLSGNKHKKGPRYELVAELERRVIADVRDGLYFELLSIGQAVGRSQDMLTLAATIRADVPETRLD